jgi:hypothetical protein
VRRRREGRVDKEEGRDINKTTICHTRQKQPKNKKKREDAKAKKIICILVFGFPLFHPHCVSVMTE